MTEPDARARAAAFAAELAQLDDVGARVPRILDGLSDEAVAVRIAALGAVAELEPLAADVAVRLRSPVRARLADAAPEVRAEACTAAAVIEGGELVPALLECLDDGAPFVRREAAAALGDLRASVAIAALVRHLADDDAEARFEAAFALASMRDARGLEVLLAGLALPKLRLDALEGLGRLGDRRAVPAIEALLDRWLLPWPERLVCLATLVSLGETRHGAALVERARAWRREERALAVALLGKHRVEAGFAVLLSIAADRQNPVRDVAIRSLGDFGRADAAPVLREIAADPRRDADERADADLALRRLGAA